MGGWDVQDTHCSVLLSLPSPGPGGLESINTRIENLNDQFSGLAVAESAPKCVLLCFVDPCPLSGSSLGWVGPALGRSCKGTCQFLCPMSIQVLFLGFPGLGPALSCGYFGFCCS